MYHIILVKENWCLKRRKDLTGFQEEIQVKYRDQDIVVASAFTIPQKWEDNKIAYLKFQGFKRISNLEFRI